MIELIIGIFIFSLVVIFLFYKAGSIRSFRILRERKGSWQLKIINHHRKRYGLQPLRTYYALDRVARGHSRYMARHHSCNHNGFSQRAIKVQRITGSGFVGENCYKYPTHGYSYNRRVAVKLVRGWMKSPEHRANLMNPNYTKLGIGIVIRDKYVYATQVFSR
jgi:uncharacterized protein YkwD